MENRETFYDFVCNLGYYIGYEYCFSFMMKNDEQFPKTVDMKEMEQYLLTKRCSMRTLSSFFSLFNRYEKYLKECKK